MSATTDSSLTNEDLFRQLFESYEPKLDKIESLPLKEIPMKDGKVMRGHTAVYGDGNQKGIRKHCIFPKCLSLHSNSETSQLEKLDVNSGICANEPQGANGTSMGFLSCVEHTRFLVDDGLDARKINNYLVYMSIVEKLSDLNSNVNISKQTDTRVKKLELKLNTFSAEDKIIYDNFTRTHEIQKVRRSSRITNETKNKIKSSVNKDNTSLVNAVVLIKNIYV